MRKTVSSNSPRHKSRQLEDFGAKWYDRRKRCPSNEPRSLWSVLVTPHPLTLYMSLHIEDKTWWKHWTKRLKDYILSQSITTAIIHKMPIIQYSCNNCVGGQHPKHWRKLDFLYRWGGRTFDVWVFISFDAGLF